MYLTEVNHWDNVKKQIRFKLSVFSGLFTTLVFIQLFAMFISFQGTGSSGTTRGVFNLNISMITGDIIFFFTVAWMIAVTVGIIRTSTIDMDHTFVSSRTTSHLANGGFLVIVSFIATITTVMAEFTLKASYYLIFGSESVAIIEAYTFFETIISVLVIFMYLLFAGAFTYFIWHLASIHILLKVIIPVVLFGLFMISFATPISKVASFYFLENNLLLFIIKITLTSAFLFGATIFYTASREVKK
ncbi:hypothetical protein [Halalkalibacillus halophilus]|uniref:hypothetical protein n=1 Tax=Halalkalibacillus halophilus TaxID=392827 RepID=UPI0004224270|nr:hypothetical protein [Halalkalibacillus halophilus]